jgi:glucose-1-phosphate cytidylyltransferase
MKTVLFCGGFGTRMREYSESIPKPMVPIGYRPILWHVMRYYAYYGHKDFILALGYKADVIKNYFRSYDETHSNDFVLSEGGKKIELLASDIDDWRITFVDTGLKANIGMRLKAVEKHLAGEEFFLANYTDGVSDLPLPAMIESFKRSGGVASFASVKPRASFHMVVADAAGRVKAIDHVTKMGARINGGFFVMRNEIFSFLEPGDELVEAPFHRLIAQDQLFTYVHDGFWASMDTFKEQRELEDLYGAGNAPWVVWNGNGH